MAGTIIKIKRSATTNIPASLSEGELAYSELSKQLFIGTNGGNDIEVIGGKFFTDYLIHTPGVLTPSAAVIVDAQSKIDNFKVDDLDLDGNVISTTTNDTDLVLSPDGTGAVDAKALKLNAGSVTVNDISNDGDLASASATQLATSLAIKTYVDSVATGLDVKESVRLGSDGTNVDLSGTSSITVDGISPADGDRILLKDQTDPIENGIYIAVTAADPSTWIRSVDADEDSEVSAGMFTFIEEGTANADSGWVVTSDDPLVLGTDPVLFSQFSGAGQVVAGDGIDKTGNTLSVDVTDLLGNGLSEDGSNNIQIAVDGVDETHIELSNEGSLIGRNQANDADVEIIKVNALDNVELPNGVQIGAQNVDDIVTLIDGSVLNTDLATALAVKNYVDAVAGGADELGELTDVTLTTPSAGDLLIFNGTGDNSVNVTMSGDVTIDGSGVTTIGTGVVENAMLVNDGITVTAGDGLKTGGAVALGGTVTLDVEPADFAGAALVDDGSDNLAVNVDDVGIEIASNALQLKDGGVANSKLANAFVTVTDGVNSSNINLGDTLTIQGADNITVTEASGTVTVGIGTIGIADGGTGLTSVGTDGQVLQSNGTSLEYGDIDGGTF